MKATNSPLFSKSELISVISISVLIITVVAIWLTNSFANFGGSY